ncbi:hypothetical protein [Streptomyces murinus]|uniref:hypothetical protein n=1 Tax=Streptomyces murinus TaxID=33900 RepID=UPI0018F3099A|nr:hypothetical protein [Streptomyces murinus]
MDTEELRRQVRALTDRAEITDLMDRCPRSLDEGVFVSAGHADTELARTADGRRICASAPRVVWTQGPPPRLPDDFTPAPMARHRAGRAG